MTERLYKIGDELDFEDHRHRTSRRLRVTVTGFVKEPGDCYMIRPIPAGRDIVAMEDELSRPRPPLIYPDLCKSP